MLIIRLLAAAALLLFSTAGGDAFIFCWAFSTSRNNYNPYQFRRHVRLNKLPSSSPSLLVGRHDVNSIRRRSSITTRLYSLQPLIDEIAIMIAESKQKQTAADINDNDNTPVIFVGGKGGVGKTSISSALAVELASRGGANCGDDDGDDDDWNVLIISTDPAHSLGDALDVDLRPHSSSSSSSEQQRPVTLSDTITNRHLHALEVDPKLALVAFQTSIKQLFNDDDTTAFQIGGMSPTKILNEMGLGMNELDALVRNPPPGLDEYVALANVLDPNFINNNDGKDSNSSSKSSSGRGRKKYDVIIVDTAPTGHTLRMLQLPQFLDGFLQTILKLRGKLVQLANTISLLTGGGGGNNNNQGGTKTMTMDDALTSITNFQRRASSLRTRLCDQTRTKFIVVTIPTILSVRESTRLMEELVEQQMCISDVVINQCIGGDLDHNNNDDDDDDDAMRRYYNRRVSGQQRWITELNEACQEVSSSVEYQDNDTSSSRGTGAVGDGIAVTEVPFYDMELVGVPALGYLGSQTFFATSNDEVTGFERLIKLDENTTTERRKNPRVVICGGKGGVGKTTTSTSLALAMSIAGHNVALVSTDPAHSLGDALDMNLSNGGSLVDVPLYGIPRPLSGTNTNDEEGSLKVMEIDPTSALKEFRDSIDKLLGKNSGSVDPSELSSALGSIGEIIDTLPAGTDEVVALAKVIQLIRRGKFDRVVLDTAPTGHTLRMLTTPAFLADLIERVLSVANKLNSNTAVKLLLSSAIKQNRGQVDDAYESAKSALLKFQVSMYDLEDMFADPDTTEFLIVTIGTELAVRESVRLLNDLTFGDPDMPIRVRNVIVNQVLENIEDCSSNNNNNTEEENNNKLRGFVKRLSTSQTSSVLEMNRAVNKLREPPRIMKVTMLDVEPRGVYGLKALSEQLLLSSSSMQAEEKIVT
jgi:arsenite-transporting ATPase